MNNETAAYFDSIAPQWDNSPAERGIRQRLTALMRLSPGGVTADIGCGKGVMLEHLLATEPAGIFAVDISGKMLEAARALCGDRRVTFYHGDFLEATLPMLDAAVIFNAYPHFTDKPALAAKLARAVKPGGVAIIAHSHGRAWINGLHRGGEVSKLSAALGEAQAEAARFAPYFEPDTLVDSDEIYFIRMIRVV